MSLSFITGSANDGNPPAALSLGTSLVVGDVVVVVLKGTTTTSLVVSDNLNPGDYSLLASYTASIFWKVVTVAGDPTVTISGQSGYTFVNLGAISGFTGTPTADTAIVATATGTGTVEAINATSNFNNECLLVAQQNANSNNQAPTVSGWAGTSGGSDPIGYYGIEASSGTANNFSGTIATSATWYLLLAGIYDKPSAPSASPGQFFFADAKIPGAALAMFMPLSWAIGRRNKLARERREDGQTERRIPVPRNREAP